MNAPIVSPASKLPWYLLMADRRPTLNSRRRVGGDGEPVVYAADEQEVVLIDLLRWSALAEAALLAEGVRGAAELNLIFVDVSTIAELNETHLGQAGPTDVLSFPIDEIDIEIMSGPGSGHRGPDRAPVDPSDLPLILGDVLICPAVAAAQAPEHAGTVDDELALLVVHGVLHVLGYDHAEDDEAQAMRARELELLMSHHWHGEAPSGFRQEHAD
jgi:probable rRNA maturation factor